MKDTITGKDVQNFFEGVKEGKLLASSERDGLYTPEEIINYIDWIRELKQKYGQ